MTISTTTSRVDVNGNGVATSFSFSPVPIFEATDLQVTMVDSLGNATVLAQGSGPTNYSLTVASYPGTGSITYPANVSGTVLPTGSKLTIKRIVPLLQSVALANQGAYLPAIQEGEFDYLTAIDQQQQEQLNRCLQLAPTDPASPLTFPSVTQRASMFLGFDISGNPIASLPSSGAPISLGMQPVVAAASPAAALVAMGFNSGIAELIIAGASPGQSLSWGAGNGNYSGQGVFLTDTGSGASFTGSTTGNTLTVTAISTGLLGVNLYFFNGTTIPGALPRLITSQLTSTMPGGALGGTGTYTFFGTPISVGSGAMTARTYSTAFGCGGTLNNPGGQIFGFFQQNILNTNGVAIGEIDCVNNTGVNPSGTFPPSQIFGTTDHIVIGTQWVALGNAQSQAAWQILGSSNNFQAGGYIWPGGVSTYGIWVDATATQSASVAFLGKTSTANIPLQLQVKGVAVPTNPFFTLLNDAGTVMGYWRQDGSIVTKGSVGDVTGGSAGAGLIGEYQAATASSLTLTNGTATNLTSVSLTAGDWDVSGVGLSTISGGSSITAQEVGISTTSATFGAFGTNTSVSGTTVAGSGQTMATPTVRINVSVTTTVYLVMANFFSAGTSTANAGLIRARRVR